MTKGTKLSEFERGEITAPKRVGKSQREISKAFGFIILITFEKVFLIFNYIYSLTFQTLFIFIEFRTLYAIISQNMKKLFNLSY